MDAATEQKAEQLVGLIETFVNGPGTWQEKRQAILSECGGELSSEVEEFVTWFEPEDEE